MIPRGTPDPRCTQRARRHASHTRGQSGVSLIEVLVVMCAMVPLTLASVYGLQTSITTSAAAEQRQRLEVALATVTEDLKAVPYLQCGSAKEYQEVYRSWVQPLTVKAEATPSSTISAVRYWNRGKDAYTTSCGGDDGAQQLTVTVTDGDMTATGSLVKRDAAARVGNSG